LAEEWSLLNLLESHSSDFFHPLLAKELSIDSMIGLRFCSSTLDCKTFHLQEIKPNYRKSKSHRICKCSPDRKESLCPQTASQQEHVIADCALGEPRFHHRLPI